MTGGKRKRMGLGLGELWQRELGGIKPRSFAHRVGASEVIVVFLKKKKILFYTIGMVDDVAVSVLIFL